MTDGKRIKVRYSLVVLRVVDDEVDTGQFAGQLEIRGTIEVSQGQGLVDLGGKHFTLKTRPLAAPDLRDFIDCYHPAKRRSWRRNSGTPISNKDFRPS